MNDPELSNRADATPPGGFAVGWFNLPAGECVVDHDPPSRWWWNERRETRASTMPGLAIQVHVAPWHWRILPWWFVDDLEPVYLVAGWLFLEIELFWSRSVK